MEAHETLGDAILELGVDWTRYRQQLDQASRYTALTMEEMARTTSRFQVSIDQLGNGLRMFASGSTQLATVTRNTRDLIDAYRGLSGATQAYVLAGRDAARVTQDIGVSLKAARQELGLTTDQTIRLTKAMELAGAEFKGLTDNVEAQNRAVEDLNQSVGEYITLHQRLRSLGPVLTPEQRRTVIAEPAYQGLMRTVGEQTTRTADLPSNVAQQLVESINVGRRIEKQLADAATGQRMLTAGGGLSADELTRLATRVERDMAPLQQTQIRTAIQEVRQEFGREAYRTSVGPERIPAGGAPGAPRPPVTYDPATRQIMIGDRPFTYSEGAAPIAGFTGGAALERLLGARTLTGQQTLGRGPIQVAVQQILARQAEEARQAADIFQIFHQAMTQGIGSLSARQFEERLRAGTGFRMPRREQVPTGGGQRLLGAGPPYEIVPYQPGADVRQQFSAVAAQIRDAAVMAGIREAMRTGEFPAAGLLGAGGTEFIMRGPSGAPGEYAAGLQAYLASAAFRGRRAPRALPPGEGISGVFGGGAGAPGSAFDARRRAFQNAMAQQRAGEDIQALLSLFPGGGGGGGRGGGGGGGGGLAAAAGGMGGGEFFRRLMFGQGGGGLGGLGFLPFPLNMLGLAGGAGFGSIGALAGLGPEHVLGTIGAIGASGAAGLAGAGTILAGAAGRLAVGGGVDLAVMKSTISDTQTLYQAQTALNKAIDTYGKNSAQAALAQSQLNTAAQQLGATFNKQGQIMQPGIAAEMQLATATANLNTLWDKQTQLARVQAVNILDQVVQLGHDYVPRVSQAAQQNLAIINVAIRPLFSWLEGPQGIQIFNDLENRFKQTLPTSIHAFTQAVEVALRFIDEASKTTGSFITTLDHFFTKLNDRSPQYFADLVNRLKGDFQLWDTFVKLLGEDLVLIFRQNAGAGKDIIGTLDGMLARLHNWLTTTQAQGQLHNLFETHKGEVLALLGVMGTLVTSFSHFYLTVSPPLTKAFTGILSVVGDLLNTLTKLGPQFTTLVASMMLMQKIGILMPILGALRGALFGVAEGEAAVSIAGGGGATGAAGAGSFLRLIPGLGAGKAAATASEAKTLGGIASRAGIILPPGVAAQAGELSLFERLAGEGSLGGLATALKGKVTAPFANVLKSLGPEGLGLSTAGAGAVGAAGLGAAGYFVGSAAQRVTGLRTGGAASAVGGLVGTLGGGAIGAAIGGPMGAMIGAGIGSSLATTLAPTAAHLFNDVFGVKKGQDYGKQWGDAFYKGLGPSFGTAVTTAVGPQTAQQMEQNLKTVTDAVGKAQARYRQDAAGGPPGIRYPGLIDQAQVEKDFNALNALQYRKGAEAGKIFVTAWGNVKFPTELAFEKSLTSALGPLSPGTMRDTAAQAMLALAQSLEANGKLPKGAVDGIISYMEFKFPELIPFLQKTGQDSDKALADSSKYQATKTTLSQTLSSLEQQWGLFNDNPNVNGNNWSKNLNQNFLDLKEELPYTQGETHKILLGQINDLKNKASQYYGGMVTDTGNKWNAMKYAIQSNVDGAAKHATDQFNSLATNINTAVSNGLMSVTQGFTLIAQATNQLISAFGGTPIPIKAQVHQQQLIQAFAAGKTGASALVHEQGGLVQVGQPGQRGADTIPMNVGGMPIVVGAGEQVAVFNAHQQAVMDNRLADYGGLGGFFQTVNTPHSRYQSGGYVFPFPKNQPFTWQRVDQGQDMQESPGGPVLAIGPGNVSIHADAFSGFGPYYAWETLTGGPMKGQTIYYGHIKTTKTGPVSAGDVIGVTQSQADQWTAAPAGWLELGLTSALGHGVHGQGAAIAPVLHALAMGHRVTGLGGGPGGAVPLLKAPRVTAPARGAIHDMMQAALQKDTDAANAYIQQQVGTSTAGSTSGLSGTLINMVRQIAKRMGWGPALIQDWLNVINAESGGNMSATNPTSAAYGIAQMLAKSGDIAANKAKYYQYGGDSNTMAGQLLAMANYIKAQWHDPSRAWSNEQSRHWYAEGGFVPFANGGLTMARRLPGQGPAVHNPTQSSGRHRGVTITKQRTPAQSAQHKPKKAVTHHPFKAPPIRHQTKFKVSGPMPGDISRPLDAINLDEVKIADLGNRLSNLQGTWGLYPIGAIITPVDDQGNALDPVVNWGGAPDMMLPLPAVSEQTEGMMDPSSNTWQYGIDVRLGEIGPVSGLGGGGTDDQTELGLQQKILGLYQDELTQARAAEGPTWTHLNQLLNQVGWYDNQGNFHAGLLNARATQRQAMLKSIAPEKSDQNLLMTERFRDLKLKARQIYQNKRLSSQLLREASVTALSDWESKTDASIPVKAPAWWIKQGMGNPITGGQAAAANWGDERALEVSQVTIAGNAWKKVVSDRAVEQFYGETLNYQEAVNALDHQETAERIRMTNFWADKRTQLQAQIAALNTKASTDKSLLDTLTGSNAVKRSVLLSLQKGAQVQEADVPGGTLNQLAQWLDPQGSLQGVSIAGLVNVQIPALRKEIRDLEATVPTQTTSGTSTALADAQNLAALQAQRLTIQAEALASQAVGFQVLTNALKSLPPFGGGFETGGIVPGPLGEARTVIAHGGESITPPGQSKPMQIQIRLEDNRTLVSVDGVQQSVTATTNTAARHARRNLPGRAGGLLS